MRRVIPIFLVCSVLAPDATNAAEVEQIAPLEREVLVESEDYRTRPLRKFIASATKDPVLYRYVDSCLLQIPRAAVAPPVEAKPADAIATIAIRADGTLETVELDRSSGDAANDAALIAAITKSAPFPVFPVELRRTADVVHITKSLAFDRPGSAVLTPPHRSTNHWPEPNSYSPPAKP